MLSVLILAAITAIAFSLATIVFIELRASGDVVRSEPALYATLGISEEAMFQYKRFVGQGASGLSFNVTNCLPANQNVCSLGGVTFTANPPQLLSEDSVPRLESVLAGQTKEIPLFHLLGPGCDEVCSWNPPYSRVELELVPIGAGGSASMTAALDWIDTSGETPSAPVEFATLTEGGGSAATQAFFNNHRYTLVLQNNSSRNMLVSIWTYDRNNSSVERGLPFIGQRVLKIMADYSGVTRTYRVYIPVP